MMTIMLWALFASFIDRYESCFATTPGTTPGTPATAACLNCAQNLIAITLGNGVKAMDGDATVTTSGCAVRTFTCLGQGANIEVNAGALGTIMDGDDGAVDGSVVFTVTCNAAGTAWENTGAPITQLECATAVVADPCLGCAANLITVTQLLPGAKAMDGDVTDVTGACAVRTFTCLGMNPTIQLNAGATQVTDAADGAADGTATVVATCNAAGTAWEVNGMAITNVECTTPCKVCAANLITVTQLLPGAKPMDGDVTDVAGACAVRTFTCLGMNPTIQLNAGATAVTDAADGAADGTATVVATCNAAGTAWEVNGMTITNIECTTPCKVCAANLVTLTTTFGGVIPTTPATIDRTGPCATWTIMCTGAMNPSFDINGGQGIIADLDDGMADGVINIDLTCNADGTAWQGFGVDITALEIMRALFYLIIFSTLIHCYESCFRTPAVTTPSLAACKTCANNLITITMENAVAKIMDGDTTVKTGVYAVRTFTCKGRNANIEIFTVAGSQGAIDDGGTGIATFTVTCNGEGTAWEADGLIVTAVECSAVPACRTCDPALVMKTKNGVGAKDILEQTALDTGCAVRTFTCMGTMAYIAVTSGAGTTNVLDGGTGTATYVVTCNADGTGWTNGGQTVTAVECSALPACQTCDPALVMKTKKGVGAKDIEEQTTLDTGCAVRTFTCMGTMANIAVTLTTGTTNVPDGGTGTATYVVSCNADGTGWTNGGQTVTAVECSETVVAACTMCATNLITVDPSDPTDPGSKEMDMDTPGTTGGCSTRTFTCTGTNSVIEINGGASMITNVAAATLVATCNAAGTAWESNGVTVTEVSCNIPCKRCVGADLIIDTAFFGMTSTTDATIVRTGACATWNLQCTGPTQQSWDIHTELGVRFEIGDDVDGTTDGIANLATTCDPTGMFWSFTGKNIVKAVCGAGPAG